LSRFVAFMTDLTLLTMGCRRQAKSDQLPAVASSDPPVPMRNADWRLKLVDLDADE
jgi:hypothetical protein